MSGKKIEDLKTLDEYISNTDNSESVVYISHIPQSCKDEPCMLGIDEAGRGPVLGPMVYGITFCPIADKPLLESLDCQDSKALTEDKRDSIFEKICENSSTVGWAVDIISPDKISACMLSRSKISLNQISMDSAINLVRKALEAGVNVKEVYVDTVGKPEKYQAYLKTVFPDLDITVAKKADALYPVVSAASICAKVTRDHALQVWDFREGIDLTQKDFGSGYPGDPVTKKFLVDHLDPVFGFPSLVRFSWATADACLNESAYLTEWEEPEDENKKPPPNSTPITSFFKVSNSSNQPTKHRFFTERFLSNTTEF